MTVDDSVKLDPSSAYHKPSDILKDDKLSRDEKIDLLKRWAYDEREKAVAEEENMLGVNADKDNVLDDILRSLLVLGVKSDDNLSPPTEQG